MESSASIDIPNAIDLVVDSLHRAEKKDVYTGGPLDIAVLTETAVSHYGKVMRQDLEDAEERRIKLIKEEYIPQPEKPTPEK